MSSPPQSEGSPEGPVYREEFILAVTVERAGTRQPWVGVSKNATARSQRRCRPANRNPKHVVSTTLERAEWNNSSIIRDDVVESIRAPIVRGHGKNLLPEAGAQHNVQIAEARVLEGGMLALRMTPVGA
jgi:hypothetical protein